MNRRRHPLKRRAAIVGVGDVELRDGSVAPGSSVLSIQAAAAMHALAQAGIAKDDVDAVFATGMWGQPGLGSLAPLTVAEYLGIDARYVDGTNIGGASFELYLGRALSAICAGFCEVALVTYGSTQRSQRTRTFANAPDLQFQYEAPFGLLYPVGAYALAAMRHFHLYGTTSADLARVAVSAREWARLNPNAMKREPLSVDQVLESPLISDPLHLLDCCLVTDGAGAIVIVAPHVAKTLDRDPIWIEGFGEAYDHASIVAMNDLTRSPAYGSAKAAYEMANVTGRDIQFGEIYDSFTITALMTVEALGFCSTGQGAEVFRDGRTHPGGNLPINTSGGGLSCLHPGMLGIFLIIEAARQMWHEAGERQVPRNELCVVSGTGGTFSSASTVILRVA